MTEQFKNLRQLQLNFGFEPKLNAADLEWCGLNSAEILYPDDERFPFKIADFEKVPAFLIVRGSFPWRERHALAVVGSREPTKSAVDWMDSNLPEFIRRNSACIVSGGARGIDQKAHALALRAGQPTVVFLPSGHASAYPSEWIDWSQEVIDAGGAVVSTYRPFQEVRRSHFAERNRWIAALGKMLFVVEAKRKSGSVMTARLARELGRTVCVLPSSPTNPKSSGTLDLLFDGAYPIRDASDLGVLFDMHALSL